MVKSFMLVTSLMLVIIFTGSFSVDPYWEHFYPGTSVLPSNAIIGGNEHESLYIIRSEHRNSVIPGKYIPSQLTAFIPWGHKSHQKYTLEILRGDNYKWVPVGKSQPVPKDAFVGGSDYSHGSLYVCRGTHLGYTIPGKIDPYYGSCYIPYNGVELERGTGNYEVLTVPEKIFPKITSLSSAIFRSVEGRDTQVKIPCVATGFPQPIITWKSEYVNISPDAKFSVVDGTLIINEPKVGDSRMYTCEANNVAGTASATFEVDILQLPKVSGEEIKTAFKDQSVAIECRILAGVPKPTISWQHQSEINSEFISISGSDNVLNISNVDTNAAGGYKCIAKNNVGESQHITTLNVSNGNLNIKEPTVSDSQNYTCEATNEAGSVSATFEAEILQMPQLQGEAVLIAVVGQPVEIKCLAIKGVPKPDLTWKFKPEADFEYGLIPESGYTLSIPNVNSSDAGTYKCTARNIVGATEHLTLLNIQSPPIITSDSSVVYKGVEGKDELLRVPCTATGRPEPIISWQLDDVAIAENAKFSIENGTLVIKRPTVNDSHMYRCEANNDVGSTNAMFKVEVSTIHTGRLVYFTITRTGHRVN